MTVEQLQQIIAQGEGLKVEFKEAKDSVPKGMYESVVSFSNTDGGTILFGVDDDGNITGVDRAAALQMQKNIVSTVNSRDCINPPLYIQPIEINHADGLVIALQIQASSQLHDHARKVYIREVDSDIDITENQQKISDIYLRKRNFFSESQIYPYLQLEDFDEKLFERARQLIRNYRSDHPWLLESDEQMLKDSSLWRKDFATDQEGYTLAAALIFGKDATIQSILPAYKAEAIVRIKNKDRWDDRLTLRTNLIDTYLELKGFINKHLPEKFYLEGDQRIDLRDKIFREVVGNVIVHREYTSALSTDLIIGETEVTITNPNKPLFHGPIDPKSFNPFPKNPNIRKFFTAFGWTDEIGSGVRNTNKFLPLYVPGAKPLFVENETFKTIIPLQWKTLGDFAENLQRWLDLPSETLPHLQRGLASVALPPALTDALWEGVILYLVPSWVKNGANLPLLGIPKNQLFEEEKIKMVPSWTKNGANLLSNKLRYLISILILATEPSKMAELLEWMSYKNRTRFRESYVDPLRQVGFLSLTNTETPNDPENKYVITEAGKAFLAGM
ncbi:MAG: AlbA family DNA-binding domain-containing protein [Pyrinomonadaceae bacterium]